jgi:ubiquinone/menaquinone biosynthesis C-methylase UbiE
MAFDPEAVRAFERDGWNRAASAYETAFATATRQFIPALLDAAGTGTDLLDVACGPGFVTRAAADRGSRVTGLDFSPAMLAVAHTRHPGLRFDHGDAEALPYADATFSAVVSNFGIHHVPRPAMALREAHRVLRLNGRFALSFWAANTENIAWKLLFDAIAACGEPKASNAPASGGGFASPEHGIAALRDAGFAHPKAVTVRGTWFHASAGALVAAFSAGTARTAAMIAAQSPATMPAILAHIEAAAAPYRSSDGLAVPIAAVIASGTRTLH